MRFYDFPSRYSVLRALLRGYAFAVCALFPSSPAYSQGAPSSPYAGTPPSYSAFNFSFMADSNFFQPPASYLYRWKGNWKSALVHRHVLSCGNSTATYMVRQHAQVRWELYKVPQGNSSKWIGTAKLLSLPELLSGSPCPGTALDGFETTWTPRPTPTAGQWIWDQVSKTLQVQNSEAIVTATSTHPFYPEAIHSGQYDDSYFPDQAGIVENIFHNMQPQLFDNANLVKTDWVCGRPFGNPQVLGTKIIASQTEVGCNATPPTDKGRFYTFLSCPETGSYFGESYYGEGELFSNEALCACQVTEEGRPSVDAAACSNRGTPPSAQECGVNFANASTGNFQVLGNDRYQFDVALSGNEFGVSRAMPADFMIAGERSTRLDPAWSSNFTSGLNELHDYLSQYLSVDGREDRLFKAGLLTFNADGYTHRFLTDVPETPPLENWIGDLPGTCDAGYGNGVSKAFSQNLAHNKRACLDASKVQRVLVLVARGQEQLSPTLEATLANIANLSQVTIFALGLNVDHSTADLLRRVVKERGTHKGVYYNVRDLSEIGSALESLATSFLPSGPATNMVVELPLAPQFTLVSAQLYRRNGQALVHIRDVEHSQGSGALHFNLQEPLNLNQEKVLRVTVEMTQCLNQTVDLFNPGTATAAFANACGLHNRILANPGAGFSPGCLSLSGAARTAEGLVVSGVLIEAQLGSQTVFTAVTDAAGTFLLPALGAGSYSLTASADGYQFAPQFQNPVVLTNQSAGNLIFTASPSNSSSSNSNGSQSSGQSSSQASSQASSQGGSSPNGSQGSTSSASSATSGGSSSAGSTSSNGSSTSNGQSSSTQTSQGTSQSNASGSNGSGSTSSSGSAGSNSSGSAAAPAPAPQIPPYPYTPSCRGLDLFGIKSAAAQELKVARKRVLRQFNAAHTPTTKRLGRKLRNFKRTMTRLENGLSAVADRIDAGETGQVRAQKVAVLTQLTADMRSAYDLSLRLLLARNAGLNRATDRRGRVRAAFDRAVQSVNETLIPYLTTRCG